VGCGDAAHPGTVTFAHVEGQLDSRADRDIGGTSMGDTTYTLDELAKAVGMTSRNVRAYRTRGLLPPPERSGRRAVYTERHLRRLLAVRSTLTQGVPLNMIAAWLANGRERELGKAPVGPPGRVVRRSRKPMEPDLAQQLIESDALALGTLIELGVISHDEDHLLVPPDMLTTIHALHAARFPLKRMLELAALVAQSSVDVAAELPNRKNGQRAEELLIRLAASAMEEAMAARGSR
jgi:DNA-binding transcriptional MerR regulator